MRIVPLVLAIAALAVLTGASPQQPVAGTIKASEPSDLMSAFRTSEVAEIYIVRRDLTSPLGLRPHVVRQLGCKYFLHNSMRQWAEFERVMADASVRIEEAPAYGEMRVGLVFGDRAGTVLEVYSSDLPMPDGRTKGFIDRREVAISASLSRTLRAFAEAHRELAVVNQSRPELCGEVEGN